MANGYYGYNPASYRKDFSWIGDIGKTLAQVAYKMPELVRYNQQVKENRGLNKQTYESMREWVGSIREGDPEVWNALAAGYNVSPDELGPTLLSRLRAPKKDEANEAYAQSVLNDFAVPIVKTGMTNGLPSGAFMRSVSNMPGVAGAGTAQGQLMQDYQARSRQRKEDELEEAKLKAEEAKAEGIREDVALAEETVSKLGGMAEAGIIPPGQATEEEAIGAMSAVRPGATQQPAARAVAGVLPKGIELEREQRLQQQGAQEPKPPASGTVRGRMLTAVRNANSELESVVSEARTNEKEIASLTKELQADDKQRITSQKMKPDKRAAKELRIARLTDANKKLTVKAEKAKEKVSDSELAVQMHDETGLGSEEIWKAIRSGQSPVIEPPSAPGGPAPGGAPGGVQQVGRYRVRQVR